MAARPAHLVPRPGSGSRSWSPGRPLGGKDDVAEELALPLAAFDAAASLDPQIAVLAADDGNRILTRLLLSGQPRILG